MKIDDQKYGFTDPKPTQYPFMRLDVPSNLDKRNYIERTTQIINTVIEFEAKSVGIEPTEEAITNFLISLVKSPPETILELKKFTSFENPFLQKIVYEHREEIAEAKSIEELKYLMQESALEKLSKLNNVPQHYILPTNDFYTKDYLEPERPSLLLSVQSSSMVGQAQNNNMFRGRIGFTADGCNSMFKQRKGGYVLIARYSKISSIAPMSRIAEVGFAKDEKEWIAFTGVPYDLIDIVLPVEIFPASIPPKDESEMEDFTPDQKIKFLKQYEQLLGLKVLDEYAKSLEYTFQETGKYLTDAQINQLEQGNLNAKEFWNNGLKPLIEFS